MRHESVYDRLNPQTAEVLWQAWKNGRNRIFHYFPGKHKGLSLEEARVIIDQLNRAMEEGLKICKI